MDLSKTIKPKSNQLNYDDFIGQGSKTIKITGIKGSTEPQQPVSISYEGDNGKPYLPCLSMRRLLVSVWGSDGSKYIGRSLTLYGDPKVVFGGIAVGGIRISHMSDISEPVTVALSASKAKRTPFTVQPLTFTKPELNPSYKGWEGAKKAVQAGTHTVEQLREKFVISEETEKMLTA